VKHYITTILLVCIIAIQTGMIAAMSKKLKATSKRTDEAIALTDTAQKQVAETLKLATKAADVAQQWRDAAVKTREDLDLCKHWVEDMAIDLIEARQKPRIKL
jgi:hypothetical protein